VGAATEEAVDVRIISASHKDLAGMVADGEFRQDLFYRIHVIELVMSPLRDRREDIPVMIDHILERLSQRSGDHKPKLERAALKRLYEHHYPGNVRELENMLERATALCEDNTIRIDDLGLAGKGQQQTDAAHADALELGLEAYLAEAERQAIVQALENSRWNRTAAAKALGISFRALRYRLEKLGLDEGADETDAESQ
jgi:two-component system response regulator PilR (NtrC family)